MSLLLEMFTYPFIVRAFVVGILVSLCAALLGVPLVLKRYSMIGDGLSHVSFGALSIAVACGWAPLPVSIPVVILAALTCAETTHTELEVGGIYYGETQRKDGKIVSAKLYDVIVPGRRRHRHQPHHRHDHGRGQLYVRLHPGHGPGGRGPQRRAVGGGTAAVRAVLPQAVCHHL